MPKPAKSSAPDSFEAALAELELLIGTMESGQLPLDASLAAYDRGAELLKFCQSRLTDTQQRVKILENNTLQLLGNDEQS